MMRTISSERPPYLRERAMRASAGDEDPIRGTRYTRRLESRGNGTGVLRSRVIGGARGRIASYYMSTIGRTEMVSRDGHVRDRGADIAGHSPMSIRNGWSPGVQLRVPGYAGHNPINSTQGNSDQGHAAPMTTLARTWVHPTPAPL